MPQSQPVTARAVNRGPAEARSLSNTRTWLIAAVLAPLVGGPACAEALKPLFQQTLPNIEGKTFTAVEVDFAPGSRADPHRHGQAFVYAYVLQGTVRSQLSGQPPQTYRAGQSWFEPPGADHLVTQNLSRSARARLLVVFISNTGDPLKTAEPAKERHAMPTLAAPPTPPAAISQPASQKMVDALYSAFGDNHARAVHAKGIMAVGTFAPSPDAAKLTKASLFAGKSLPVLVRFSDFTGIPNIPDNIGEANPRGFALKFTLPNGSNADVVTHSFNGFPTATTEEFRQLLLAIGASGAGVAKPTALDSFLGGHPIAKTFLTTQKPPPASYATLSYFGVNAFEYTAANGRKAFVRYRFTPQAGEAFVPAAELPGKGPNYLQDELPQRLARGPIVFDWYAQVAEPGDVIDNPSIAWPESRRLVKLGTVRVDHLAPDPIATEKATMFRPLSVPVGIAPADPMLGVRQAAYPLSFAHRQGAAPPSATPAGAH
ncbi:catalase [Phenylobacterium sp.]|uniref:catalase n=1 Tax=Phenylobacterium sp. TaxID=1871053 RepID=UPI0025EB4228|nr:catalase [Phenylobacterium sp.]